MAAKDSTKSLRRMASRTLSIERHPVEKEANLLTKELSNERVQEADGNFFESFTALSWKQENRRLRANNEEEQESDKPPPPESNAGLRPEIPSLPRREFESLYVELLYTIKNKVGTTSDGHTPYEQELFSYAQQIHFTSIALTLKCKILTLFYFVSASETCNLAIADIFEEKTINLSAFQVPTEDHKHFLAMASKEQSPTLILNVTVVAAKDLEAKDANGYSDPYCMLGIMPGAGLLGVGESDEEKEDKPKKKLSLKHRGSKKDKQKNKSVRDQLPAKLIKVTEVKRESLNPVWNEKFRFQIDDIKGDKLHLDIWDHDDETSVFDAARRLNEVTGIKGMGRFFKQIVQSARTSSKGNVDDFLGCLNIDLDGIPSRGIEKWFELEGRTSKSNVQGQLRLKLNLSTEQRPAETEHMTAITAHQTILEKFIEYELHSLPSNSYSWSGELSSEANTILHQHALQNDITEVEEAMCNWLAFSKEHMQYALDYAFLYKLLRSLDKVWVPTSLSSDYEEMLADSLCSFIEFCLALLRKQRDLFPPANKAAYYRLEYLLICLDLIYHMKFFKTCCPFKKELHREIIDVIKKGTVDWYETVYALAEPQVQSEEEQVTSLVSLTDTLNTDIQRAVKYYHKLYQNIVKVDYFTITYKQLEKLIAEDVGRAMEEVNRNIKARDEKDEDYTIGTSLFELYLSLKELLSYKQYLSPNDAKNLAIANFHHWFKYCVQRWLEIAQNKAMSRIKKSVELDKIALVDSMVKHSTSAVDTSCCFAQIREFWQKLDWPDTIGSYIYVTKVTDDITKGATYYADVMHDKLKQNGYFDEEGQFDVTEQLCITINDIEHVRKSLKPLPQILGYSEIHHAMDKAHGSKSAKQSKEALQSLLKSADEDMCNRIWHIVQRVGEKMRADIKKFVFHLTWAPQSVPADDAICPLMEYLDNNLITLNNCLLRANFDRILEEIWNVVLNELQEQVESNEGKEPVFYERLFDALEILIDFFYADDKGLSMDLIMSENCKLLLNYLKLNKTSTEELVELYYLEKIDEQVHRESTEFGTLSVKCYYSQEREKLCIQVLSATNVIPLDSNGLSDPFVIVELCPKHIFNRYDPKQTKVVKKTLHPLFDEHFEFVVSAANCRHRGSCVLFTVMDHDIILTNDFAGEAYMCLNNIPGLSSDAGGFDKVKQTSLILSQPQASTGNDLFSILEGRGNSDKTAQELIKKRLHLIEKVQSQS